MIKVATVRDRRDEVIAAAAAAVARAMDDGATHGYTDEWARQSVAEHVTHSAQHSLDHLRNDTSEDHLAHGLCRLAMAILRRDDET